MGKLCNERYHRRWMLIYKWITSLQACRWVKYWLFVGAVEDHSYSEGTAGEEGCHHTWLGELHWWPASEDHGDGRRCMHAAEGRQGCSSTVEHAEDDTSVDGASDWLRALVYFVCRSLACRWQRHGHVKRRLVIVWWWSVCDDGLMVMHCWSSCLEHFSFRSAVGRVLEFNCYIYAFVCIWVQAIWFVTVATDIDTDCTLLLLDVKLCGLLLF